MKSGSTIPHPPWRVPILGDVLGIDRARPMQQATRQFARWGPILKRTFLGHDFVAVGSAELAEQVFDETVWRKYVGPPLRALRPLAGNGLLVQRDGPEWERAHAAAVPAFGREPMQGYHAVMVDAIERAVRYLRTESGSAGPLDAFELTSALTLDIASRTTLGESDVVLGERSSGVSDALTRTLHAITSTSMIAPQWERRRRPRTWRRFDDDVAALHERVDRVIRGRRSDSDGEHNDLLQYLLNPPDGAALSDAEIRDNAVTFLLAGHETTASTMATALHLLATHPQVARRVRDEVGAGGLEFHDVARLRFTRAVVHETLRLWPSTTGVFRQARTDTQLAGHPFQEGDWVLVVLLAAQRDRSWGAEPEGFDPDRFLDPRTGKARVSSLFRPFGYGPRQCIGRAFALHELTLALAMLVREFDLVGQPGYRLRMTEAVTLRPEGLRITFQRR